MIFFERGGKVKKKDSCSYRSFDYVMRPGWPATHALHDLVTPRSYPATSLHRSGFTIDRVVLDWVSQRYNQPLWANDLQITDLCSASRMLSEVENCAARARLRSRCLRTPPACLQLCQFSILKILSSARGIHYSLPFKIL